MKKVSTLIAAMSFVALTASAQVNNPIKVNQVGFYPNQEKTASIEEAGWSKQYTLTNEKGKTVWKGKAVRTAEKEWSGKKRQIIDFSTVTTPGTYTLSNGKDKQKVVIAEDALKDLSVASIKAFYLQRTGEPILEKHAGEYAREAAHMDTNVMIHPSAASKGRPAGTIINSAGGWYDAGDFNKYIVNSAFTVALMLDAYEMNPDYYKALEVNIPESGDNIPDLLDEIMVNIRWMQTMQDPIDGGVYHKLTTPNFEGFIMPKECKQQRYVVQKTTAAALDFAATMAKASRIYGEFSEYKTWAELALAQAKAAYKWAQQHPSVPYRQGEMNKKFAPQVNTGAYDDEHLSDEFFWAAAELFISTKDQSYVNELRDNLPSKFEIPTWGNVYGLAIYSAVKPIMEGKLPMNSEIKGYLQNWITGYADNYMREVSNSCFNGPFGNDAKDFGWGCLAENCLGRGIAMMYAYKLTGYEKYRDTALKALNYVLGQNATGYCYVTGFGSTPSMHPHQRLSHADGIENPLPGFLVGGPNPGQQDKATCNSYTSNIPDESYTDDMNSYASNEIAINWNAALVALLGMIK